MAIRVALVEDHAELRTTLKLFLRFLGNSEVVFVANNGREAVDCAQHHKPDILVMDIRMPILDGLEATRQIVELALPTRVILISSFSGSGTIQAARKVGAAAFIHKKDLIESLPKALKTVYDGGHFFPEE